MTGPSHLLEAIVPTDMVLTRYMVGVQVLCRQGKLWASSHWCSSLWHWGREGKNALHGIIVQAPGSLCPIALKCPILSHKPTRWSCRLSATGTTAHKPADWGGGC